MDPIRVTGWTTWAWWPSTRSTSGDAAICRTADRCPASGSVWYSVPWCRLTMTRSAPAARARRASASTRVGTSRLTDHALPGGGMLPLRSRVYDRCATATSPTGRRVVAAAVASRAVRARPAWPIPAASSASRVRVMPGDTLVERVVAGVRAGVEPGRGDARDDVRRGRERRVAAVGAAGRGEGGLQVAHRQVHGRDPAARPGEQRPEVQGRAGVAPHAGVDQDLAGRGDRDPPPRVRVGTAVGRAGAAAGMPGARPGAGRRRGSGAAAVRRVRRPMAGSVQAGSRRTSARRSRPGSAAARTAAAPGRTHSTPS